MVELCCASSLLDLDVFRKVCFWFGRSRVPAMQCKCTYLTGAQKTFNTCEDLHNGFLAFPKRVRLFYCVKRNRFFCLLRSQMCMLLFFFAFFILIELSYLMPVRPNRSVCSDPNEVNYVLFRKFPKKNDRSMSKTILLTQKHNDLVCYISIF